MRNPEQIATATAPLAKNNQQLASLRQLVNQTMPVVLQAEWERRVDFIERLHQIITRIVKNRHTDVESAALIAYLRGCMALLCGEPIDTSVLLPGDRHQLATWENWWVHPHEHNAQLPTAIRSALVRRDTDALDSLLAQLLLEERAAVVAELQQHAQKHGSASLKNWEAFREIVRKHHIASVADHVQELASQALAEADAFEQRNLAVTITALAEHYATGEQPDSPYHDLVLFLEAVVALLWEQETPPVPSIYVERVVALRRAMRPASI